MKNSFMFWTFVFIFILDTEKYNNISSVVVMCLKGKKCLKWKLDGSFVRKDNILLKCYKKAYRNTGKILWFQKNAAINVYKQKNYPKCWKIW